MRQLPGAPRRGRAAASLALPMIAYFALFLAYPTAHAVRLAFTDPFSGAFPSAENFRLLRADPLFWRALANNAILPALSVALEVILGLALALFLSLRFPGRRFLRTAVIVPFALPEIVFLTAMRYVFAPRGYANGALVLLGLPPVEWLLPGRVATLATVVAADAWRVTPVVFLLFLAALASIPEEIGEAAVLDGATGWRRLVHITLPLLRPALRAALLLRGVDALRIFATPLVVAGAEGAPVLSTYAYHQWSDYGNEGMAAAAATALALLSAVCAAPLLRREVRR